MQKIEQKIQINLWALVFFIILLMPLSVLAESNQINSESTGGQLNEVETYTPSPSTPMATPDFMKDDSKSELENFNQFMNNGGMKLSLALLAFSTLVLLMGCFLMLKGIPIEGVLKVFGTILIIVSAVFLVVTGYSDQQIAPVMGLLGTIAGYLIGNTQVSDKKNIEES